MRRGFLRIYLLKLIGDAGEDGISGYSLMKQIEEQTGFWRPSPGSIYPLLKALEDAGLIEHRTEDDRKFYSLTLKGREGLARAQAAKEEATEGVRRSIRVLGELFGEEAEIDLSVHLARVCSRIAPKLRRSIHTLRILLLEILSQDLPSEKTEKINAVLEKAIEELKKHVPCDRS